MCEQLGTDCRTSCLCLQPPSLPHLLLRTTPTKDLFSYILLEKTLLYPLLPCEMRVLFPPARAFCSYSTYTTQPKELYHNRCSDTMTQMWLPVYPIQCILTDTIIIWFNHLDKNHFHQISIILVAQICLHQCSKFINPQKESLYFYRMYFLL